MRRLAILVLLSAPQAASAYTCIEVAEFVVDKESIESKQDQRAAMIPEELLGAIQKYVTLEIPLAMPGVTGVAQGEQRCKPGDQVAVLSGTVTDYKPGNRAMRYLVGFGAGAQKFPVQATLTDKATGAVLGSDEIVDRKVAGWAGGSDEKGMEDFSEKIAGFIARAIGRD